MRKKRKDVVNVTQLFVLKHCGPESDKKGSSFKEAVVGFTAGSDEYDNSWPSLSGHQTKFKKNINVYSNASTSSNEIQLPTQHERISSSSFPGLRDIVRKHRTETSRCEFRQATNILKKVKCKKSTPLRIDLESALEAAAKCRRGKELKRLERKKPMKIGTSVAGNSGNPLDSADPVRKRGKVRPDRKKKLSSLRKAIMKLKMRSQLENPEQIEPVVKPVINIFGAELTEDQIKLVKDSHIHTSKFREYCTNFASQELVGAVKELVMKLREFQDRMHRRDEVKARARRRYVVGLHETWKLLQADSFKLLIMATNIERNEALLDKIKQFVQESARRGVPLIFAGTCSDLSYWLLKKNRTCVLGIINYDGANDIYQKVMTLFERDKVSYELNIKQILQQQTCMESTDDVNGELVLQMLQKLRTD